MPEELKPLGLNGAPQPAAPASTTSTAAPATSDASSNSAPQRTPEDSALGGGDDIARWIAEHPETDDSASTTDASATATDPNAAAATSAATTTAATTAAPANAAPAAADPTKPADQAAAVATTQTTAPKTYEPTEKIALAEGVEWTREQVITGLRERVAAINEAQAYRNAIGLDPNAAAQLLTPVLQRLKAQPAVAAFIDGYLTDPERAAYLDKCSKFYDEENGTQAAATTSPAAPAPAQLDPQTQQTITELRQWKQERDLADARDRFNREIADAQTKYPILATDRELLAQVGLFAETLHRTDPRLGLPDAIARMARTLDAVQAQANAAGAATTAVAAPAAPVPALLASPGASPTSTRPAASRPDPALDPVDEWLKVGARAAGFE